MLNTQNWLSLIEYSARYRVSLSTLRRRIKAGEVEFKLIEGKYLLKNDPLHVQVSHSGSETIAPPPLVNSQSQIATSPGPVTAAPAIAPAAAPASIQTVLAELKLAFAKTLSTKDEQIVQLREEIADLRMLVRMLEDENQRLKISTPGLTFDLGLEA